MKKQLKNVQIGVSKHYQLYPGWENINGVAYTETSVANCFANYLETEHGADVYITSGFNHVVDGEYVDIFADIYNFEFCALSSDVAKLGKYGGLEIDRETMFCISGKEYKWEDFVLSNLSESDLEEIDINSNKEEYISAMKEFWSKGEMSGWFFFRPYKGNVDYEDFCSNSDNDWELKGYWNSQWSPEEWGPAVEDIDFTGISEA